LFLSSTKELAVESVQVVSLSKKEVDDAVIEKAKTFAGSKVGGAKICYLEGGAQVTFQCNRSVSSVAAAAERSFRGDADAS
jgi:hypothetical protein